MKKGKSEIKHTSVYLNQDIADAVTKVSKEEGRSFTKQIERILKDWLTEHGYLKKEK